MDSTTGGTEDQFYRGIRIEKYVGWRGPINVWRAPLAAIGRKKDCKVSIDTVHFKGG